MEGEDSSGMMVVEEEDRQGERGDAWESLSPNFIKTK